MSWLVRTPGRPKSAIQYPQAASQMAITINATPKMKSCIDVPQHSMAFYFDVPVWNHQKKAKVDARLKSFSIEHFVQGQLVQRPSTIQVELMGNV